MSFIVAKAGGIHKLSSLTGFGMVAVARDSLVELPALEESSKASASCEAPGGHGVCLLSLHGFEILKKILIECLDARELEFGVCILGQKMFHVFSVQFGLMGYQSGRS